jgi:hypothetical protein
MKATSHSNTVIVPGVGSFVETKDNTAAKATALRLGVLDGLENAMKELSKRTVDPHGAFVIGRDRDTLFLIVKWAGFSNEADNGFVLVRAIPANERTIQVLIKTGQRLVEGDQPPEVKLMQPVLS